MGNGIAGRKFTVDESSGQREPLGTEEYAGMALTHEDKKLLTRSLAVPCHRSYIFSDFRFQRPIGSGRFSKVYLAQSIKIAANAGFLNYAIKEVSVGQMTKQQLLEFRYELNLLSHLQHPHLPRISSVYDVHGSDTQVGNHNMPRSIVYVVMDHLSGGELLPALCRQRQYMEADALRLVRQLVSAVCYLHSQGVAHGSLLPENLILTQAGSIESALRLVNFSRAESELHHHPSAMASCDVSHLAELRVPEVLYHYGFHYNHGTGSIQIPSTVSHMVNSSNITNTGAAAASSLSSHRHWFVRERMAMDVWCVGAIAHLLLSGFLPGDDQVDDGRLLDDDHHSEDDDDNHYMQQLPQHQHGFNGFVSFQANRWTYSSDDAKLFIQSVLQQSPMDRPVIEDMSHHPWLSPASTSASVTQQEPQTTTPPVIRHRATLARPTLLVQPPRPSIHSHQRRKDVIYEENEDTDTDNDGDKEEKEDTHPLVRENPNQDDEKEEDDVLYMSDEEDDQWSFHQHYDLSIVLPHLRAFYQQQLTSSQSAFSSLSKVPLTAHSTRYSLEGERFILCYGKLPFLLPEEEDSAGGKTTSEETLRELWSKEQRSKRLQAVANAIANLHGK